MCPVLPMSTHNAPVVQDTVNLWLAKDGAELTYGILAIAKQTMTTEDRRAANLVMLSIQAAMNGSDRHASRDVRA